VARVGAAIQEQEDVIANMISMGSNPDFCKYFPELATKMNSGRHPLRFPRVPGSLLRVDLDRNSFEVIETL